MVKTENENDNDFILHGPKMQFDEKRGLGEVVYESLNKYGSQICQINSLNGEEETFSSVQIRCIRLATSMASKGIKAGDMISICSFNNIDTVVPYVAATYLNCIMSFLDPTLSLQTTIYLLNIGKPKVIFCGPEAMKLIEKATDENSFPTTLVVFGETVENHISFADYSDNVSVEEMENFQPMCVENNRETALVLFSSGTTGLPKGICLSHHMIMHQVASLGHLEYDIIRIAHFTSFYWFTGNLICLAGLLQGLERIIIPNFNPKTALQILQDYKVNYVFMANIYIHFIMAEQYEQFDLSHLKYIIISGATMTKELMMLARKIFSHSNVLCSYGMTEAGYITHFNPKIHKHFMDSKIISVGKLNFDLEAKVVNVETNEAVGPGVIGELRIKGNNFMIGYYHQDSLDPWDEDGWLKTGDLCYYDKDECVFIVDRIKDLIKYQSWHVVPTMIESVLLTHPKIQEAVVFGLPHEEDGDHPAALVVLTSGSTELATQDILDYVNERVHDRERLRGGVKIVKQIPKTPTGKYLRRQIKLMILNNEI